MMTGIGMPISQSTAPLPKPMTASSVVCRHINAVGTKKFHDDLLTRIHQAECRTMRLISRIKEWEAHAVFHGKRPSWWRRLLIRLVVGTKFPKKMKAEFSPL
jgi:hypothetical protein